MSSPLFSFVASLGGKSGGLISSRTPSPGAGCSQPVGIDVWVNPEGGGGMAKAFAFTSPSIPLSLRASCSLGSVELEGPGCVSQPTDFIGIDEVGGGCAAPSPSLIISFFLCRLRAASFPTTEIFWGAGCITQPACRRRGGIGREADVELLLASPRPFVPSFVPCARLGGGCEHPPEPPPPLWREARGGLDVLFSEQSVGCLP